MTAAILSDTRCLAMAPVMLALLAVPASAADNPSAQDLNRIEQQLDASKSRQEEISTEIDAISREEAALSQKSVELAETIQSREAAILAGEDRLKVIEAEGL